MKYVIIIILAIVITLAAVAYWFGTAFMQTFW